MWNPAFRRNPQDWELDQIERFLEMLYACKVCANREDYVLWEGEKSRIFSVQSYYQKIRRSNKLFPWKAVWKSKAPARVSVFMWEAANGAVLTGDNLCIRKKFYVNWCYMCKGDGETVNHLLVHCLELPRISGISSSDYSGCLG